MKMSHVIIMACWREKGGEGVSWLAHGFLMFSPRHITFFMVSSVSFLLLSFSHLLYLPSVLSLSSDNNMTT